MLNLAAGVSLKILFMWAAMREGNIFFFLRRLIDWAIAPLPGRVFLFIRKPLYECLFCMSSLWGILFSWPLVREHYSADYVTLLFAVGGINYILETVLKSYEQQF